jgi:hypothetical protein
VRYLACDAISPRELAIRKIADSPHARPTLRALPYTRVSTAAHSL